MSALRHGAARGKGTALHYVELGEGPTVVLLHGFPETWRSWRHQLEPLARAGYRVLCPDLRGYGASDVGGPYDLDTLADDVACLLDHAGVARAAVIGHDWGGGVAWHFASRHAVRCTRVAALNAPHPAPFQRALRSNLRQMLRSWYMFFFLLPWLPEWLARRRDFAFLKDYYRPVEGSALTVGDVEPCLRSLEGEGRLSAAIDYYRTAVWAGLKSPRAFQRSRVEQPAMLLWGRSDCWLDEATLVPATKQWVPQLEVQTFDAHHYVHQERPDEVTRTLVGFLAADLATVSAPELVADRF